MNHDERILQDDERILQINRNKAVQPENDRLLSLEEEKRDKSIAANAANNSINKPNVQLSSFKEKNKNKTNAAAANNSVNNSNNAQLFSLEDITAQKTNSYNNFSSIGLLNSNNDNDLNYKALQLTDNSPMTNVGYKKDQIDSNNGVTNTRSSKSTTYNNMHNNDLNYKSQVTDSNGPMTHVGYRNDTNTNNGVTTTTTSSTASSFGNLDNLNDKAQERTNSEFTPASTTDNEHLINHKERVARKNSDFTTTTSTNLNNNEVVRSNELIAGSPAGEIIRSSFSVMRNRNSLCDVYSSGLMHDDSIRSNPHSLLVNDESDQEMNGNDSDANLAIASPVLPDEESVERYLPAAIEFDPDQKAAEKIKNYRRKLLTYITVFMIIISVIVVSVVTGIVISMNNNNDNNNNNNDNTTIAEVNPREQLGIKELVISQIIGDDNSYSDNDIKNPFNKALEWITNIDPLQLTIDSPNFLQRFIIVHFYYTTSMEREWQYCVTTSTNNNNTADNNITETNTNITDDNNTSDECRLSFDCIRSQCLLKKRQLPWLRIENECEWAGITCDKSGNILGIEIGNLNLTGSLSDIKMKFPFIKILELSNGELKGAIPSNINQWKHLTRLSIQANKINGIIPMEFWYHRNIISFHVYSNNISGLLFPPSSSFDDLVLSKSWKNYQNFDVGNNQLSGTISSAIVTHLNKNLYRLHFDGNNFEGTIPSELFILSDLRHLKLNYNQFTGSIPEIINLPLLRSLCLESNQLNGTIPDSLYNCTSLMELFLSKNQLSGTISTKIANLNKLFKFEIELNQFGNSIPSEIGQLTLLTDVNIIGNNFNDTIPIELCDLKYLTLTTLRADCLSTTSTTETIPALIVCPKDCCTECCTESGKKCLSM